MDESFNSLDETTRHSLQRSTKKIISETNNTVLFVTHDIEEALYMSDKLLVFGKDKIKFIENPKDFSKEDLRNMI